MVAAGAEFAHYRRNQAVGIDLCTNSFFEHKTVNSLSSSHQADNVRDAWEDGLLADQAQHSMHRRWPHRAFSEAACARRRGGDRPVFGSIRRGDVRQAFPYAENSLIVASGWKRPASGKNAKTDFRHTELREKCCRTTLSRSSTA
ncbi:hypothetical protein [Lentzea sp. NPDC059081]|uniref:hypothetical protein n=1 Tax=Lentzea sp. NPDC059081 TaxID=3346719 RepID=UPI00369A7FC5